MTYEQRQARIAACRAVALRHRVGLERNGVDYLEACLKHRFGVGRRADSLRYAPARAGDRLLIEQKATRLGDEVQRELERNPAAVPAPRVRQSSWPSGW